MTISVPSVRNGHAQGNRVINRGRKTQIKGRTNLLPLLRRQTIKRKGCTTLLSSLIAGWVMIMHHLSANDPKNYEAIVHSRLNEDPIAHIESASCGVDPIPIKNLSCIDSVDYLVQQFGLNQMDACWHALKQGSCVGIVPWEWDNTGRDKTRDERVRWWMNNPHASIGISCAVHDNLAFSRSTSSGIANNSPMDSHARDEKFQGFDIPPPIFEGRVPNIGNKRAQVALVISFVEFQHHKVAALLTEHWSKAPPCHSNTPVQSADLVFFTESKLSSSIQRRIRMVYADLGVSMTGCFRSQEPIFLNLAEVDPKLSHLEGAAYAFYSLFRLLENSYKTFILTEPDIVPIQPNFLPALVNESVSVNCGANGVWQAGSSPLVNDIEAGMLKERLDYHMNGNAIYALGCPEFEDYKCRVQSFYVPQGDCKYVAGCSSFRQYEGGYDHAMYRYRMDPENYEYSRLILPKFIYSNFAQNRGESIYNPGLVRNQSPSTYFVHSKSIFQSAAATVLKEVTVSILRRDTCQWGSGRGKVIVPDDIQNQRKLVLAKIFRRLHSGEYKKEDAIRHLCDASLSRIFDLQSSKCKELALSDVTPIWPNRMPKKTYLWTMDVHGGPANCDMSVITEAGGAVHAEIIGKCEFYGLCVERLKVLKFDGMKEYDPSEQQKKDFTIAYKDDPEFKRVDAFICHHPVANCELFLPFQRPIIIHATTRMEFGRHDAGIDWRLNAGYDKDVGKEKWRQWIKTVQTLAKHEHNIIAANNLYDRDYIKYFTGIEKVELIPSWCGDSIGSQFCEDGWESAIPKGWQPSKPEVVIVPYRSNLDRTRFNTNVWEPINHPIIKELSEVSNKRNDGTIVRRIAELYTDANPLHMLNHPAIIIMPYQVSTIQLIELYRLNIPAFCPSLSLLKRWCREHDLMWEASYGWPENLMEVKDIPNPNASQSLDKYSSEWEETFDHWMPKSDFYQYKHITYFDSWEHFFSQYETMSKNGELEEINLRMAKVNAALKADLIETWRDVLVRVKSYKKENASPVQ